MDKKKKAEYQRRYREGSAVKRVLTICKCPKCEVMYERRMNWIGIGTPRIYCESCNESIRKMGTNMLYGYYFVPHR